MILALLLLIASSAPDRLLLVDDTLQVPPKEWRSVDIILKQQPASLECRFEVADEGAGVRVALLRRSELERLSESRAHQVILSTTYRSSGQFRYTPREAGEFAIVVDNRMEGRRAAEVHLTVSLVFKHEETIVVGVVSPQRKLTVILLSLLFFLAVVTWSGRRLLRVIRVKRTPEQRPPSS